MRLQIISPCCAACYRGEDVTDKIAALAEPLRHIAEEAQMKIWEIEVRKP